MFFFWPQMEHLMKIIGGSDIETLVTYETLARMSLSAVKQPGIALAYEEILGFDGDGARADSGCARCARCACTATARDTRHPTPAPLGALDAGPLVAAAFPFRCSKGIT